MNEDQSIYECLSPSTGIWHTCTMGRCARERRINKRLDMLVRLEHYKSKLDAGLELTDIEREDLEGIAQVIIEVLNSFLEALEEAFKPIIEALTTALKTFWDGLPEQLKVELMSEAAPRLKMELNPEVFGEVATPYGSAQQTAFPQPYETFADRLKGNLS